MLSMSCVLPYLLLVSTLAANSVEAKVVWLDQLDLGYVVQGWGTAQAQKSIQGKPLQIGNESFVHGIGTHSPGQCSFDLHGKAFHFDARIGIDAETGERGSAVFQVVVDGRKVFDSGLRTGGMPPVQVSVDLSGAESLSLVVTDGGDGFDFDHADWADTRISCEDGSTPAPMPLYKSDTLITTHQPRSDPLVSKRAVELAQRSGQPWLNWTATGVKGYHLLQLQPGKCQVETLTGTPPSRSEGVFANEHALKKNEVLVVDQKSSPAVQIRVLQQPRDENDFQATVEIDAPVSVQHLELAFFRVPLADVFKEFHTADGTSTLQNRAAEAELSGNYTAASAGWESVALSSRNRIVRTFALERYFAILPILPTSINTLERDRVNEAMKHYTDQKISSGFLVGRHVIWVLPKDVISNAAMKRAFAEADAVYGFLRYISDNDTNTRLGRRLVIRYMVESTYSGGLYGDHGVGFGGKGPQLPYDGRSGLFHEISHDVMNGPNFLNTVPGFGEGWATFAVVPAFDYFGWDELRDGLKERFIQTFESYRAKGANYDQLPGYDANAGFLLRITERLCPGFNWVPLRAWQHAARNSEEPGDPSERIKSFVALLRSVGGNNSFDDEFLHSIGLPVTVVDHK